VTLAQPLACLLDEDLDPALADQLAVASGWQVTSVRAEGWLGVKNGPLLQAMAEAYRRVLGNRRSRALTPAPCPASGARHWRGAVRAPARAAERLEAIARAVIGARAGKLIEVTGEVAANCSTEQISRARGRAQSRRRRIRAVRAHNDNEQEDASRAHEECASCRKHQPPQAR